MDKKAATAENALNSKKCRDFKRESPKMIDKKGQIVCQTAK